MKVKVTDIEKKMRSVLVERGYSDVDVDFIIDMYLGGELRGFSTHGLANFAGFAASDYSSLPKPTIIKETHSTLIVDAKSNPGVLIGRWLADEAIKRAKTEVMATVMIKDMNSWLRPGAIAEYIANQGFVGIVVNDGGGGSIAPPGGFDPTTGTNPIAYGIPTEDEPLVVDMATSKLRWGQVRLANKYGTDLPADTFDDDQGNITVDPQEAYSVKPFGEYKGFALSLLVEILCDSLLGMPTMVESTAGSTFAGKLPVRGAMILVMDPGQTVGNSDFKSSSTDLLNKIRNSQPRKGEEVRIPGEHSAELKKKYLEEDSIDIPAELWDEIQAI